MTKEELKNKCTKRAKIFQQAMESCHSSSPIDCIEWLADRVEELEAQIEKMKCCGNCENGELSAHEEPCLHCQRCFASTDVTDQENVKDNWEAIKEIKEK